MSSSGTVNYLSLDEFLHRTGGTAPIASRENDTVGLNQLLPGCAESIMLCACALFC